MGKGFWVDEETGRTTKFEPAGHKATRYYSEKHWKEAKNYSNIVKGRNASKSSSSNKSNNSSGDCDILGALFSIVSFAFTVVFGLIGLFFKGCFKLGDKIDEKQKAKAKKLVEKYEEKNASPVGKPMTMLICLIFGFIGLHRFYARRKKEGLVTLGIVAILFTALIVLSDFDYGWLGPVCGSCFITLTVWWVIDFFAILFSKYKDNEKRPIIRKYKLGGYCSQINGYE